jgi:hypothetical protein
VNLIQKYKLYYLPVLLIFFTVLLLKMIFVFSYSVDNGGLEFYFINIFQHLHTGKPLYPNPELFPYSNCLYTPVYFHVLQCFIWLLHLDPKTDIYELLVLGRSISFALVFGQCIYIVKIISKYKTGFFIQLLSVGLYLLMLTDHIFATRPDAFKLFFLSAFLYHLINFHFQHSTKKDFILSLVFSLLAIFSKQDIIIHITLCYFVVLLLKRNRLAFYHAIAFAILCVILFIGCYFMYGEFIFVNTILLNIQQVTELHKSYLINIIPLSIIRTLPLVLLAVYNFKKSRKQPFEKEIKFISIVSFGLYFLSHILITRAGANLNYTYELIFILVINYPIYIALNPIKSVSRKIIQYIIMLCYFTFILVSNMGIRAINFNTSHLSTFKNEYYQYITDKPLVDSIIKEDTVFFPNTKFSIFYSDKKVILGHDMHLDRFIELYTTNAEIRSKLPFINTQSYDKNFTNGVIKYILIENDEKSKKQLTENYPLYSPYAKSKYLLIYRYSK